jgi:hypothetical protein
LIGEYTYVDVERRLEGWNGRPSNRGGLIPTQKQLIRMLAMADWHVVKVKGDSNRRTVYRWKETRRKLRS